MQQSARFGIENYQRLEEQCVKVRFNFQKKCTKIVPKRIAIDIKLNLKRIGITIMPFSLLVH